jgi:serine/threonine-protein kinase
VDALKPDEIIGHFLLLEKLGAGGLGEVWRARDQTLNRTVALKFVTAGGRELLKEARAASALNHPNIVTVFEVGDSPHGVYMAMELVDGETLRARMSRGELSASEIADIAAQVAEGLGVAHAAGIVHRDLKPENIMVRADGYVKVLDFGLAKRLPWASPEDAGSMTASVGTVTGQLAGTFAYMSPEQARGMEIGPASDVFSFGTILHEMATGQHPFRGATVMDTLHNIISKDPPEALHTLANVVRRCLAKDPAQRYADARFLAEVLQVTDRAGTPPLLSSPAAGATKQDGIVVPTSRWLQGLGALLSAALMVMAFVPDLSFASGQAAASRPKVGSVAVLALHAPAEDKSLSSFAQDLAEDLSGRLAGSGMQVSAQSAIEALGPSAGPQQAAQQLSVDAVFTGAIRISGDQVKVRIELVDRQGFQLWADTFVSRRDQVAAEEQKMAEEILARMRLGLAGDLAKEVH